MIGAPDDFLGYLFLEGLWVAFAKANETMRQTGKSRTCVRGAGRTVRRGHQELDSIR
jgi:hypothetical protein